MSTSTTMTATKAALLVTALLGLGCRARPPARHKVPELPAPHGTTPATGPVAGVLVWPPDMSTNVGAAAKPTVTVKTGAEGVSPALLATIKARIRLVTWPERKPVGAAIEVRHPALASLGGRKEDAARRAVTRSFTEGPTLTLVVSPTTSLADRWYALEIAELPGNVAFLFAEGTGARKGAFRFRPGQDRRVTGIEVVTAPPEKTGLTLMFSEPADPSSLVARAGVLDVADGAGQRSTCTLAGPTGEVGALRVRCPLALLESIARKAKDGASTALELGFRQSSLQRFELAGAKGRSCGPGCTTASTAAAPL
jgi:hypothetical protein